MRKRLRRFPPPLYSISLSKSLRNSQNFAQPTSSATAFGGSRKMASDRHPREVLLFISGPQQGPAERGHVKERQKSSKSVNNIFDIFRAGQKNVKNRQKVSKIFSTSFDNFRAAPVFRPLLGASDFSAFCPPPPRLCPAFVKGVFAKGFRRKPSKVK